MKKELTLYQEEWLPVICKHFNIKEDNVTFVYVSSITGKNKMQIRYNEFEEDKK